VRQLVTPIAAGIAVALVLALSHSPRGAAAGIKAADRSIEAAFAAESYAPGDVASLKLFSRVSGLSVQIFHAGSERLHTRRPDVMKGMPTGAGRVVGSRVAGATVGLRIGPWPSGLYFARLKSGDGSLGFAPFVVRPRRLGQHRIAVVLPTQTWQAYNFRDDNGDGRPDTWYAGNGDTARLSRPFLHRGVPPRFRHYDLPFLHWLTWTGKRADYLADADLRAIESSKTLAREYDLLVFEGHHEYVTTHEYDLVQGYRDLGGNLMFLFADDFDWRIAVHDNVMTRIDRWRNLGHPQAALIGAQYRASDRGARKAPWVVAATDDFSWLFRGTGFHRGSRFGSGGIELDATAPSSPPGVRVPARISNLFGPTYTGEMTYYETARGAKVFAAGAFDLVESILEPDRPLPDAGARANQTSARRMLENLWAQLITPGAQAPRR
jgi:hypothetical protein